MSDATVDNNPDPVDEILAEYFRRLDRGEHVDREAWIAAYPQHARRLRKFLIDEDALCSALERTEPAAQPESSPPESPPARMQSLCIPLRLLGEGGLGRVWLAREVELHRDVALKEISLRHKMGDETRHRFLREAQVTGQLDHPNIVPIYALGEEGPDGRLCYTMRRVRGRTLSDAIAAYHRRIEEEGPDALEQHRLLSAHVSVAGAVAYANQRGVIHRDLKPRNVMLGDFGEVVVVDWGLAKVLDRAGPAHPTDAGCGSVELDAEIAADATSGGTVAGSPLYMAPEQASGRIDQIDERTDVYGLGAILFEILTGKAPHEGKAPMAERIRRIAAGETVRARKVRSDVPPALDAICAKAMAPNPGDRYRTAALLAEDVRRWLADEPVSVYRDPLSRRAARWIRRHRNAVVASVALLASILVAAVAWRILEGARDGRAGQQAESLLRDGREAMMNLRPQDALDQFTRAEAAACQRPRLQELAAEAASLRQQAARRLETERRIGALHGDLARQVAEIEIYTMSGDTIKERQACQTLLRQCAAEKWEELLQVEQASPMLAEQARQCRQSMVAVLALSARSGLAIASSPARTEQIRQALELLDRADRLDPGRRVVYRLRARCHGALQETQREADWDRRAVASKNVCAFDWFLEGEALRRQANYRAAIPLYEEALVIDPLHFCCQSMLATCLLKLQQPRLALAAYDQAIRLRHNSAWAYSARALAYADLGAWREAEDDLRHAESLGLPEDIAANYRGIALFARAMSDMAEVDAGSSGQWEHVWKRLEEARVQFDRCREKNPSFADVWVYLGGLHHQQARLAQAAGRTSAAKQSLKQALAAYAKALELGADPLQTRLDRGTVETEWRLFEDAAKDYDQAALLGAQTPATHMGCGKLCHARAQEAIRADAIPTAVARLAESVAHYTRALALDPHDAEALFGRAMARFELLQLAVRQKTSVYDPSAWVAVIADLDLVESSFRDALDRRQRAELYRTRAVVRDRNHDLNGALSDFHQSLLENPQQPFVRLRRGWALLLNQQQAFEEFSLALKDQGLMDPQGTADAYNGRGYAEALLGNDRQAVDDAATALRTAPQQWQILYNAACVYSLASGIATERHDSPRASGYADRAVDLLHKAVDQGLGLAIQRGLEPADMMDKDRSLIHLRNHKGFHFVLDAMRAAQAHAKPAQK